MFKKPARLLLGDERHSSSKSSRKWPWSTTFLKNSPRHTSCPVNLRPIRYDKWRLLFLLSLLKSLRTDPALVGVMFKAKFCQVLKEAHLFCFGSCSVTMSLLLFKNFVSLLRQKIRILAQQWWGRCFLEYFSQTVHGFHIFCIHFSKLRFELFYQAFLDQGILSASHHRLSAGLRQRGEG